MLAPVSEAELEPPELIGLARDSLNRFPGFVAGVEELAGETCGYRTEGTLWVAMDRDAMAELRHVEGTLVERGFEASRVDGPEVLREEPHLAGRVLGGLRVRRAHQVDPRRLCGCLARAVERLGGRIRTGAAVERVTSREGRVCGVFARLDDGRALQVEASKVVVAAGAWSYRDIALPLDRIGLRPVKGQLVRLRGPGLLRHVVRTTEVYMVPRSDGELLVGATMEEMGFEQTPTAGAAMDLLRRAWQALPGIYDLELTEISVGLRSAVDDHLPVVGETDVAGLFLAVGHFRNGVLLAPATATHLTSWITGGRPPEELAPFAPSRLMRENTASPDHS
jgi:glycine oxidase